MPGERRRRTIDLRPGDEVRARNRYRLILAIEIVSDDWLSGGSRWLSVRPKPITKRLRAC